MITEHGRIASGDRSVAATPSSPTVSPVPASIPCAGFTPGPWRIEDGTNLIWGGCDLGDLSNNGMGTPIVEADRKDRRWGRDISQAEHDANSRLIAAAPDLYEAAAQLVGRFDELRGVTDAERIVTGQSTAPVRKTAEQAIADLRSALARARGEA